MLQKMLDELADKYPALEDQAMELKSSIDDMKPSIEDDQEEKSVMDEEDELDMMSEDEDMLADEDEEEDDRMM
jgi:hypothetical protein